MDPVILHTAKNTLMFPPNRPPLHPTTILYISLLCVAHSPLYFSEIASICLRGPQVQTRISSNDIIISNLTRNLKCAEGGWKER